MALSVVTLTWDIEDLVLSAVGPSLLSVNPVSSLPFVTENITMADVSRSVTFTGGTGSLTGIIATDNTEVPAGFRYAISVINAVDQRFTLIPAFTTAIRFADGSTQDLTDLLVHIL